MLFLNEISSTKELQYELDNASSYAVALLLISYALHDSTSIVSEMKPFSTFWYGSLRGGKTHSIGRGAQRTEEGLWF